LQPFFRYIVYLSGRSNGDFVVTISQETLEQAIKGDDAAFNEIVELFQRPVFNLCYRMLGNDEAAEDAAQETFLRAYRSIRRYNPQRSFGTWLMAIAANYCIDQHRKRKIQLTEIDEVMEETTSDPNTPNPETESLNLEQRNRIQGILKELPELDRAALILRYWYESTEEEISQILNLSISAVKSRLHRARKKTALLMAESNYPGLSIERKF
jgi:RNA polymerase sigma-70 factor (ECF subfamily)